MLSFTWNRVCQRDSNWILICIIWRLLFHVKWGWAKIKSPENHQKDLPLKVSVWYLVYIKYKISYRWRWRKVLATYIEKILSTGTRFILMNSSKSIKLNQKSTMMKDTQIMPEWELDENQKEFISSHFSTIYHAF